jgi:uncharacterized membrane protein (UPF0127 family)
MVRPYANPSNQAAMNILQTMRSTFTSFIFTISSLILTVLLPSTANAEGVPQTQLPRTTLNAGMHLLQVQLAQDFEQRQIGLMWRKEMPQNEGMLFIFEQPAVQCFWMRNTYLPLTAAFVADDGTIVNLADMKPMNDSSHCSNKPVRFVLEMNQGWFAKRNIQAGYKLTGPVFTK